MTGTTARNRRAAERPGPAAWAALLFIILAVTACGTGTRVHIEGGADGIDEWEVAVPF